MEWVGGLAKTEKGGHLSLLSERAPWSMRYAPSSCCQNSNEIEQRHLMLLSWRIIPWHMGWLVLHSTILISGCCKIFALVTQLRRSKYPRPSVIPTFRLISANGYEATSKQIREHPINWDTLHGLTFRLSPICHAAKIPLLSQLYFHSRGGREEQNLQSSSLDCTFVWLGH